MHPRLAKKIVRRVQDGDAAFTSYRRQQVEDAFRFMGCELTTEHLKPWLDAEATRIANTPTPEELQAHQEAAKLRMEEREAAKELRREALAKQKQLREQAMNMSFEQVIESARAAYEAVVSAPDDVVAKGSVELTLEFEPEPEPTPEPEEPEEPESLGDAFRQTLDEQLAEKTVGELRALARDQHLSGYSTMRKEELIDLLARNVYGGPVSHDPIPEP